MPGPKKPRKKAPAKRTPKPKTTAEEEASKPIDGILVRLTPDENPGDSAITVQTLGAVKVTEVPTLLRVAAKNAETQLGIG